MPNRSFISVVLCFMSFLLIYGITSRADLQISDEFAVFVSGVSLATRGSLDIDELGWLQEREHLGQEGIDGHIYAKYFPGNILGTGLIYRLTQKDHDVPYISLSYGLTPEPHVLAPSNFGARLALRLNALLGALGIATLYAILLRRFDWKTATVSVLLFGLCTDWWYQARGLFSEIGAGTFLILSLAFAELSFPSFSGLALGISLLFRPTNLLGTPVWLYGVWKKGWGWIWTGIFIASGLGMLLTYNWIRFRSILDFGYADEGFSSWIVEGLVGVILSPGRSFFFYSPLLILCISGGMALFKSDRVFTGTILTVIVVQILSTAMWHDWDGGTSWGSRLITPVLPLLAILVTPMIEKALSPTPEKTRFYIVLLASLGFGIQLLTLTANTLYVLVYYVLIEAVPYSDSINSFRNSWLSLQIQFLEHWNICNIDSYSLRLLFTHCK